MANYVGLNLSRLIKERAYLSGSLPSMQKEVVDLQSNLKAKENELAQSTDRLAELDKQIAELSAIDPNDIRPIKATPREMIGAHGSFRQELIRLLKSYDEPVSSGELIDYMAKKFGYQMNSTKQLRAARDAVCRPLNVFRERGVVERHPSLDGSQQGRWLWVGAKEDNQPWSSLKNQFSLTFIPAAIIHPVR